MTAVAQAMRAVAVTATAMALALLVAILVMWRGPEIEGRIAPVFRVEQVLGVERAGDGYTSVSLLIDKRRRCKYGGTTIAASDADDPPRMVPFEPSGDSRTRPLGPQIVQWTVDTRGIAPGGELRGLWVHECHGLWDTQTEFGPWRIP